MSASQIKDVLFRIWFYRLGHKTRAIIDLMSREKDGFYSDRWEALVIEDEHGLFRLVPRKEGKDIPDVWYATIEINLLAPVALGKIHPYRNHVFGKGKVIGFIDSSGYFNTSELKEVALISPKEYQRQGGGLFEEEVPENYAKKIESVSSRIFLCHSSKDKLFVRRLAKELKGNNVETWFDEEDIVVGQNWIDSIQEGIKNADFVAVVLTPNFLEGPWANQELKMALIHEAKIGREKILPIFKRDCEIPAILTSKQYADFRGNKFKSGFQNLLRGIFTLSNGKST